MNGKVLRPPLIKSALLLTVVSLLVYLTATSPEGSLWASLGTLFIAFFRTVQLALGLVIALVFCMVVLTTIFLGCVALISRESAAAMLEQLRQGTSDRLLYVRSLVVRDMPSRGTRVLAEHGREMKKEISAEMEDSLETIRLNQTSTEDMMEGIGQRLEKLEQDETLASFVTRLDSQEEHIRVVSADGETLQDQLQLFQEKIDGMAVQLHAMKDESAMTDMNIRMTALETSIASLEEKLTGISTLLQSIGEKDSDTVEETVDHRLFTHMANSAMREKVEQLVTETLDTDMSYAQVMEYLIEKSKGKTAEVIQEHPTLAKEYIRYRRNNG